jgi:hypothetical protein
MRIRAIKGICAARIPPLLLLVMLTLPAAVHAQFKFETNNGALTIIEYTGPGGEVVIPDTTNGMQVSSIGDFAFHLKANVTNVTIPNSVTRIANSAFRRCTSLIDIVIPDTVTSMGNAVFQECYSLTNITVGSGITSVGNLAFLSCYNLASATLGSAVTSIGNSAFAVVL